MNGDFPHEVATPTIPWRNSLLNFDLLACACELLSTPFFSLWTVELDDGPGMRGAAAFLYKHAAGPRPLALPRRRQPLPRSSPPRVALLLAGRAYTRPEYVELWRTLPAPQAPFIIPGETFATSAPIRQPLLWTARAPHGA